MQQQVSVITLAVSSIPRSKHFYVDGFGWKPVFENEEIVFYQMNGFVLGTFTQSGLEADMNQRDLVKPGPYALGHNVAARDQVKSVMDQLVAAGGRVLRYAGAPPHGGFRGYVADPDDHAWEIAWNPAWAIDHRGLVTFGV